MLTGNDLRERRERLGYTQQQLATELGLTQGTISRWENGKLAIEHPVLLNLALQALEAIACLDGNIIQI